jgi:hypothetical protein
MSATRTVSLAEQAISLLEINGVTAAPANSELLFLIKFRRDEFIRTSFAFIKDTEKLHLT